MGLTDQDVPSVDRSKPGMRILICVLILLAGVAGMTGLSSLKKLPAEVPNNELPIQVSAILANYEEVAVRIVGYGEAKPLDSVSIVPEVSGKIVQIHPRLEPGERIGKSELLFAVDPLNYRAALQEATASVVQLENTVYRLQSQLKTDTDRLETLKRNYELALSEFERVRNLFDKDHVGTRSGVDAAEQTMNLARDRMDQMNQAITLAPIQIREAAGALEMARAKQLLAEANLNRCQVRAPFNGRISECRLEEGQYVPVGQTVLTLANDEMLEIQVPLDSRDAQKWLRFSVEDRNTDQAWFNRVVPVPCRIFWTESPENRFWEGTLHRVIGFDAQTRTLTVAIRVSGHQSRSLNNASLPLVEGMFCRVSIPGKTMENVVRLPRWAVSFENTVHLARNNRLKTVPVALARVQGEEAFVASGISPGDAVVTTRLVAPLENALLSVTPPPAHK